MLPGFTGLLHRSVVRYPPAVRQAGPWDTPSGTTCEPTGTDTFCTGLVLWCTNNYRCYSEQQGSYLTSTTPYPCGVCVGISNPSSW
jgi:hypothetical protein